MFNNENCSSLYTIHLSHSSFLCLSLASLLPSSIVNLLKNKFVDTKNVKEGQDETLVHFMDCYVQLYSLHSVENVFILMKSVF